MLSDCGTDHADTEHTRRNGFDVACYDIDGLERNGLSHSGKQTYYRLRIFPLVVIGRGDFCYSCVNSGTNFFRMLNASSGYRSAYSRFISMSLSREGSPIFMLLTKIFG